MPISSTARTSEAVAAILSRSGSVPASSGSQPRIGTSSALATASPLARVGRNVSRAAAPPTPSTDPITRARARSIGRREGSGLIGTVAVSMTDGVVSEAEPRLDRSESRWISCWVSVEISLSSNVMRSARIWAFTAVVCGLAGSTARFLSWSFNDVISTLSAAIWSVTVLICASSAALCAAGLTARRV